MNIHQIIDRLDEWLASGKAKGSNRTYSIMKHGQYDFYSVYIHPRGGKCMVLKEYSNLLRLF